MSIIETWNIEVTDENSNAIDDAIVVFDLQKKVSGSYPFTGAAATHKLTKKGTGIYAKSGFKPSKDDWLLAVHKSGRAPVVQRISLDQSGGVFNTTANGPQAATVAINAHSVKNKKGNVVKTVTLGVTLEPANEFVFVSGIDNHGNSDFGLFATSRATELRRRGEITDGTMVTLFPFRDSKRVVTVPQRGGGFMTVLDQPISRTGLQNNSTISIVDVYNYLGAVGRARPRSVAEFSLFSHAFIGGPLLIHSNDGSTTDRRDSSDGDGRTKDFKPINVVANLNKAFSSGGVVKIWGCLAVEEFHQSTQAALGEIQKGTSRDQLFIVFYRLKKEDDKRELHTTINMVKHEMDQMFRGSKETYGAAFSNFLGKNSVFQAPPGVGASFLSSKISGTKIQSMSTDMTLFKKVYEYFTTEFNAVATSDPIDTGYFDFTASRNKPAVSQPADPSGYLLIAPDSSANTANITLGFKRRETITHPSANVTGSVRAFSTGLGTASKGHRIVLTDRKTPANSGAFFVQASDEKIFKLNFNAATRQWEIPSGATPI